jgi:uncharacterized phage protein (TIGR01671 family)
MNREIKFEYGFESVNGTVKKVYHLHEIPSIQQKCDVWNVLPIKYVRQSTGLKDKNGNEIYEGDILCNDEYKTWEWRGVVKFSHGVFGAEWLANVKSQSMVGSWGQKHNLRKLDDDILERQVIVGNIFENPELLSEQS